VDPCVRDRVLVSSAPSAPGTVVLVEQLVRAEAFERVLRIETSRGSGAAFTVEWRNREWLVTARHLLPDEPAPEVVLSSRHGRDRLRLPFVPGLTGQADVAVAPLQTPITPQLGLLPSSEGIAWSQAVYFLGFPYGMATQLSDVETDRIAFVKQAIVSASARIAGTHLWYLDGHNNPGFSGGPVVAHTETSGAMQVLGIVAGNRSAPRPVLRANEKLEDAVVAENTGIILATDISHAIELMELA
jgi:hypothetical protein